MISQHHQRTPTLVLAVFLLMPLSALLCVCAYAPSVIIPATTTTTRLHQSLSAFDDSEWYCPPPATRAKELTKTRTLPGQKALQTDVVTVQQLEDILHDGDERLTIVKIYASWCKSCAKFSRKLDLFASKHADIVDNNYSVRNRGTVRIVNVEYGAAVELCRSMHVKQLPTVHMYQSGQKVQDFVCPPSQFYRVTELTEYYVKRQFNTGATRDTTQREQFFESTLESTLDKGRSMIQGKLQEEELARGLQAASSSAGDDGKTATRKPRFWNLFRRVKE